MKESYGEGLATHTGPESCGACEGGVEALAGERAGRIFSRVRHFLRDADTVGVSGRQYPGRRYREALRSPSRSQTPGTYGSISSGNREIPCPPGAGRLAGRLGKFKD